MMKSQYSSPRTTTPQPLPLDRQKLVLLCWHQRQDGTGFPSVRQVYDQTVAKAIINAALNERTGVRMKSAHLMDLTGGVPKLVATLMP